MDSVCCGCQGIVSNENAKNILNDDLLIESSDYIDAGSIVCKKIIKLYDGIELLTGYKVPKDLNSAVLCASCCQKIESFTVFRMQLLDTFEKRTNYNNSENISKSISNLESLQCLEHQKNSLIMDKITDVIVNKIPNNYRLLEPKITVDDGIDVIDNSIPLELNNSLSDESETNDSLGSNKLSNDQENNNLNDSDYSNEVPDINHSKVAFSKIQDNDIESEVDIYSGEYDEVLELDVQCKNDDITDSENFSESEAEIYDYEPIGKKIKNYNALSSALLF
ncbi:superoxide-generating NADPH oxidase heavy chain subunit C-like [Vespula pensylvanica]|uniref:superoxide-generating NADPH oxidase heavy chain subunit C-like n=1 Tax=Vespula pensylvanica TaxID=30213 RepID=UPI001CBA465D|nr:superoxide-generating NADPH oxidase heavy chain subunit C-like [Vespula pensylvanica]